MHSFDEKARYRILERIFLCDIIIVMNKLYASWE
jgi:hypothetical protein